MAKDAPARLYFLRGLELEAMDMPASPAEMQRAMKFISMVEKALGIEMPASFEPN